MAYVDDFIYCARTLADANAVKDAFEQYCKACNIELSPLQAQDPSTTPTILGLKFDTKAMIVTLPMEKA